MDRQSSNIYSGTKYHLIQKCKFRMSDGKYFYVYKKTLIIESFLQTSTILKIIKNLSSSNEKKFKNLY